MRQLTARFSSIIFFMTVEGVTGKTLSVSTTNFTSKVICSGTQAADNNAASPRNSLNNVISLKFSSSIMARASPSGIKKRPRQLVIKPEIVSPFGKRCISERFDIYSFWSSVSRLYTGICFTAVVLSVLSVSFNTFMFIFYVLLFSKIPFLIHFTVSESVSSTGRGLKLSALLAFSSENRPLEHNTLTA